MLKTVAPILASLNASETIQFYTEKLNFTLIANWDGYVIFNRDDKSIHLWPCDDRRIAENSGCYVYVTEVDKLYAEYTGAGIIHPNGKLKVMPWKLKQFSVLDNNGNIIHFGEAVDSVG